MRANLIVRSVYISQHLDEVLKNEAIDQNICKTELMQHYLELGMKAAQRPTRTTGQRRSHKRDKLNPSTQQSPGQTPY